MDEEAREALNLSKDDLLRMAAEGKRARIARKAPRHLRGKRDMNQRAAAVVAEVVEKSESPPHGAIVIGPAPDIVITDSRFGRGELQIPSNPSVTIRP